MTNPLPTPLPRSRTPRKPARALSGGPPVDGQRALTPVGAAGAQPLLVALYAGAWILVALGLFTAGHRWWGPESTPPLAAGDGGPETQPTLVHRAALTEPPSAPHTEREMSRLCRSVSEGTERRVALGPPSDWAASSNVRAAVRSQHLNLDWRCYLEQQTADGTWTCLTRPTGGARFDLRLEGAAADALRGDEAWVSFRHLRRALTSERQAQLAVGPRCSVEVTVRDPNLLQRATSPDPSPDDLAPAAPPASGRQFGRR